MKRLFGACLIAAALPAAAIAGPLSFADAIGRAVDTAPSSAAARLGAEAARAQAKAAGALPDPWLAIGIDNFPISGPPAFGLSQDDMTMARIGIEQDVPNSAKRRAARGMAQAEIGAAEAGSVAMIRRIRLATGLAWLDLHYGLRRLAAVDAVLAELRPLSRAVPSGVASGAVRPAQSLQTAQAIAVLEDRRDGLVAAVASARASLTRWTGDRDPQPIGPPPTLPLEPASLRQNLAQHPDLRVADASVVRADAGVDVARAEKRPDWGFDVAYQRRDQRYGDMVSAGVKMSLPLFTGRRQEPMIAARASDAARAAADREGVRRTLTAELESGLADHVMHHQQWERARDTLLPLARQRADLERASYGAGRASIMEVIEAQTQRADAELTALDREAEVARDAVRLSITYGKDDQ